MEHFKGMLIHFCSIMTQFPKYACQVLNVFTDKDVTEPFGGNINFNTLCTMKWECPFLYLVDKENWRVWIPKAHLKKSSSTKILVLPQYNYALKTNWPVSESLGAQSIQMWENVPRPEVRPVGMWGLLMALPPFLPILVPQGMEVMEDHDPSHSVSHSVDKSLTCREQKPRNSHWLCFFLYFPEIFSILRITLQNT